MNCRRAFINALAAVVIMAAWPMGLGVADVYEWTDDQGNTHFSDNIGNIPEEYRKKARKISTDEAGKGETPAAKSPPVSERKSGGKAPRLPRGPRLDSPSIPADKTRGVAGAAAFQRYVVSFRGEGQNVKYVKVRVNNEAPTWMLLDTGATYCMLSRPLAKTAGIDFGSSTPLVFLGTASGVIAEPLVKVDRVEVGGAELKNVYATVKAPIRSEGKASIRPFNPDQKNGILGMSFLDHFRVTVNSERRRLILEPRSGFDGADVRGGHTEAWWRGQFQAIRGSVEGAQRQLERLKERPEGYQDMKKRLEITIDFFQREFSDLERKASHANVPQEWRK